MCRVILISTYVLLFIIIKIQCTTSNADCDIEGITDSEWLTGYLNDPVDDFHENEFKKFSVKNIEGVEINGEDYGKYFGVKLEGDHLSISPTEAFKNFEINEKSVNNPEMHINLYFDCTIGKRYLTFHQPIRDTNTYHPIFAEPLYVYNLPMPLPADFELSPFGTKIIACDFDISNVRLDVAITPLEDFSVTWDGPVNDTNKYHTIIVKTINPVRLIHSRDYLITVSDIGVPPRTTNVDLKVQINEQTSVPPNPYFNSAHYNAIYHSNEENHRISLLKPINLKRGCMNLKLEILELEYQDKFRVKCNLEEVIVELANNLPNNIWNSSVLLVTIQATLDYAEKPGRTVLEIYYPELEQTSTTVDTCNVECSPCSAASNNTECVQNEEIQPDKYQSSTLHYQMKVFIITLTYCHIGYLGTLTAMPVPKENIKYYLKFESDFLEYNEDTGVLKKKQCATPNTFHNFEVCALGISTGSNSCANVLVHETGSYTGSLSSQIMFVQHIREEHERVIQLPCNYHCTCTIFEQYPVLSDELFICESGQIYASAIDREMEDIQNMKSPQFTLHLNLEDNSRQKRSTNKNNFKEFVFIPSKVFDEHNQILLTIIIDDINDNPPTFQAEGKLVVGYPIKELAEQILPLYLTKVVATDLDAGENATIRYSINRTNINVLIHPETGIIYPCSNDFDNKTDLTFLVRATDRNGAEDGLWTDLEVEVKLLMSHHILTLQMKTTIPDDVDHMLMKISNLTGFQVNYLNSTIIFEDDWSDYLTEIIIYGLDYENEPVNVKDLQVAIEYHFSKDTIMIKNIEYKIHDEGCGCVKNGTTFCIVIPTILLLLLVCLFASAGYWFYKTYKNRKQ